MESWVGPGRSVVWCILFNLFFILACLKPSGFIRVACSVECCSHSSPAAAAAAAIVVAMHGFVWSGVMHVKVLTGCLNRNRSWPLDFHCLVHTIYPCTSMHVGVAVSGSATVIF